MAQKYSPEIVLTDMCMPKMDGANMAKSIRGILPDCAFIFISGYSDIAYYKSAVQVSALDFVNKPLVIEELLKVLEKSVSQIKDSREKKEYYSIYKGNELAIHIINENADPDKLMDMWTGYGMPYGEKYALYTLILTQNHKNSAILHIDKLAKESGICVCVGSIKTGYVIHTAIPLINSSLLNKFTQGLLNKHNDEDTHLAIGKPVSHPKELRDSYSEAANLIRLSFFYPERQVFTYEETTSSLVNDYDSVNEISQLLCCDPDKAKQWVESQFEKLRNHAGTPVEMVRSWGFRVCTELYFHWERIKDVNIHAIPINETELWDKISSLNTLHDLKQFMLEIIDIMDCSYASNDNSPIVWKVQRYICKNFSKPLSLKSLSEHVNMSTTYLCSLFKDRTGQTINSYIFDVRIHRAKLMLESSNMHINEIADASGFSSSSYFIKAFRKVTGITPQEYRKEHTVL